MNRPVIVCLCGSTRFGEAYREANLRETLAGHIVLSIGCDTKSDTDLALAGEITPEKKADLDLLHLYKVYLADEVLFLNVGGYLGTSSLVEHFFAAHWGKTIRYLEPVPANRYYIEASDPGTAFIHKLREAGTLPEEFMHEINRRTWFREDWTA